MDIGTICGFLFELRYASGIRIDEMILTERGFCRKRD
jgi:hypothetical protein